MTAHKHAELIKAKAENMDLVIFFKQEGRDWLKTHQSNANELPAFYEDCEYFACHPKHADVCLHWLNGGEVYPVGEFNKDRHAVTSKDLYGPWYKESCFMCEAYDFCIKPRQEKRWVGVQLNTGNTTNAYIGDAGLDYAKKEIKMKGGDITEWQFIEIEFEV